MVMAGPGHAERGDHAAIAKFQAYRRILRLAIGAGALRLLPPRVAQPVENGLAAPARPAADPEHRAREDAGTYPAAQGIGAHAGELLHRVAVQEGIRVRRVHSSARALAGWCGRFRGHTCSNVLMKLDADRSWEFWPLCLARFAALYVRAREGSVHAQAIPGAACAAATCC